MASEHSEKLRDYLKNLVERGPAAAASAGPGFESFDVAGAAPSLSVEGLESMARDSRELESAARGLEHFEADDEILDDEAFALEAIILPRERPVLDIMGGSFHEPPPPWKHFGADPFRSVIEHAVKSVGRVEVRNHPSLPYAGTGFVVGEGLLMTNRHVAVNFASGLGRRQLVFNAGLAPGIDFKQEVIPSPAVVLDFEDVVMIHPYWDCALIRVSGLSDEHPALTLDGREPDDADNREMAIVGYPAQDHRNDQELQNRIFRGIYQRKRMQPGRTTGYGSVRSYDNVVEALTHDSSTLGGNSGSLVLDVNTGRVLGLHFAGIYLESNYAVPAWELALDARVRDAGVNFENAPAPADPVPWAAAWASADPGDDAAAAEGAAALTAPPSTPPSAPTPSATPGEMAVGIDWYESLDDSALEEAIALDPDGTRERLTMVLGAEEANEIMADFAAESLEVLEAPADPDLPEIIYLHGIMGSHLANDLKKGKRIWFSLRAFLAGNVAEKISLADDGFSDREPGFRISSQGHLRSQYGRAAKRWRKAGFVVHEFAYDWRKPVDSAAASLDAFIEGQAAQGPNRRFALVAHSMGGLVASMYAAKHRRWDRRIERAVFAGSPLGGSYAPIEAVLGVYPFFKTLALLGNNDDKDDLARLAATLPGLMDILPDRGLFDDEADWYRSGPWPEDPRPLKRWLRRSKGLKREILGSPLLERTTGIVSREIGTVGGVTVDAEGRMVAGAPTAPGDGTVPVRAAAVRGLARLHEARGKKHASLFKLDGVIQAVDDILRTGRTEALPPLAVADIDFDAVIPEKESLEAVEDRMGGIKERFDKGLLTSADLEWIFDPEGEAPPQ